MSQVISFSEMFENYEEEVKPFLNNLMQQEHEQAQQAAAVAAKDDKELYSYCCQCGQYAPVVSLDVYGNCC